MDSEWACGRCGHIHDDDRACRSTRIGATETCNCPVNYLSRTQVAERIGVTPGALSRYKLPEPDVQVGTVRGWLPETIDAWQAARPGRGARTDLRKIT